MIIIKGILVFGAAIVVPVILGNLITLHMEEQYKGNVIANWVFGIVLMFAQLQLLAVPMIIADLQFHSLFYIYVSIIALEVLFTFFKYKDVMISGLKNCIPMTKKTGILGALVICSILMQGFMLSYFEHVDDDDARFVPSAVAAVEKDMMFEENPVTGEMLYSRISEVFKDMVSPWIMFWAVLSKVTAIHPAILMHSVVPLIFIPLAYAVYWMLAGLLFKEDMDKKVIFTGLVSAIHIFSGYSVFNSGAFLLFRIWQGKALFAAIFVPLLFFVALRMFMMEGKCRLQDYFLISAVCSGACLTSGFGIILSAMFFGLISVIYGISKKNLKGMLCIWVSLLPCVVYGFLYAFGEKLFM